MKQLSISLFLYTCFSVFGLYADVDIREFMPAETGDRWSYLGTLQSDAVQTRINARVEATTPLDWKGRRFQRIKQEVVPSYSEALDDVNFINNVKFQSVDRGIEVFREEIGSDIYPYKYIVEILPSTITFNKSYKFCTEMDPDVGSSGKVNYHTTVLGYEMLNTRAGQFETLKINQEKTTELYSGEEETLSSKTVAYTSSWYAKGVGLVKQENNITSFGSEGSGVVNYDLELVASPYTPNYLWPDAVETPQGWKYVEWFGYLTDDYFPWIYHRDHGWLFVDAESTSEIKLWSESLGWWLTSKELYPMFYSVDHEDWLTYIEGSTDPRTFLTQTGEKIEEGNYFSWFGPDASAPPSSLVDNPRSSTGNRQFEDREGREFTDTENGFEQDLGEAPEVQILLPENRAVYEEEEIVYIKISASDVDEDLTEVVLSIDGIEYKTFTGNAPYLTSYTPPEPGSYQINVVARDIAENETSLSTSFTVEAAPIIEPEIRITSPLNRTEFSLGNAIEIYASASDEDGSIDHVIFYVDGIQVSDPDKRYPYNTSYTPPVAGSYSLSAKAYDDDDNETTSQSISVTVLQSEAPVVRITNPLNKEDYSVDDTVEIMVDVQDADSPIEWVRIFVDGIQIGSDLISPPYKATYRFPVAGSYTIGAQAQDQYDVRASASNITVEVN